MDDTLADGTQVLSISASKIGYVGYSAGLNVTDNENPALTMSINPLSISEAGGYEPMPKAEMMRSAAYDAPIAAGETGYSAQVTVVYGIAD